MILKMQVLLEGVFYSLDEEFIILGRRLRNWQALESRLWWGVGVGGWEGREGLPGVQLEVSSMKVEKLPTLQAVLNSWEAQLLSGALQVSKHWTFWARPLPLGFTGSVKALASSSPYSAGGRKGSQSLQVSDNRVPSPDTEWLKGFFF